MTKLDKGEANPMTSFCCSNGASTVCEPFEISCFYIGDVKNQRYTHIHVENFVFLLSKESGSFVFKPKKLALGLKSEIF